MPRCSNASARPAIDAAEVEKQAKTAEAKAERGGKSVSEMVEAINGIVTKYSTRSNRPSTYTAPDRRASSRLSA